MKQPDRASLEKRRPIIIADLLAKVEAEDWHGVADAAMDLREIDAMLSVLTAGSSVADAVQSRLSEHQHQYLYDIGTDSLKCPCGDKLQASEIKLNAQIFGRQAEI